MSQTKVTVCDVCGKEHEGIDNADPVNWGNLEVLMYPPTTNGKKELDAPRIYMDVCDSCFRNINELGVEELTQLLANLLNNL